MKLTHEVYKTTAKQYLFLCTFFVAKGAIMKKTNQIVLSAMFITIGLVLPFLTGQIPQIGSQLSPMHFPVFICGMVLGPEMGGIVGFITPLLRSILFGMPPMIYASCMAFEMATYGLIGGYLYKTKKQNCYISLILAMIFGRIVWGIVSYIIHDTFTLPMFISGAFLTAIPGIILQIIIVPILTKALSKHMK